METFDETLWRGLLRDPDVVTGLSEALSLEESDTRAKQFGFEWYQIHLDPMKLKRLVTLRVMDVASSSRSSMYYKLRDPDAVKRALELVQVEETQDENTGLPGDLFEPIIGHDNVKELLLRSLRAPPEKPVHVLLCGPASSSKSLFLQEIAGLPKARLTLGGSNSKVGIIDFILDNRPRYLLLDEIDKMDSRDFDVLYSLMEFGLITRLKHGMTEQVKVPIKIYAAANKTSTIPVEIVSRFAVERIPPYSDDEFHNVVVGFLTAREGVSPDIAEYIASELAGRTKDPRLARHVARLSRTRAEVDSLLSDPNFGVPFGGSA